MLTLKAMGIEDVVRFDFMQPPTVPSMFTALRQLYLLGALDEDGNLTALGTSLAGMPLDPQFSTCCLAAKKLGCLDDMFTLCACLSAEEMFVKDEIEEGETKRTRTDQWWRAVDVDSDHWTLIHIYEGWIKSGKAERYAQQVGVSQRSLRHAEEVRRQLETALNTDFRATKIAGLASDMIDAGETAVEAAKLRSPSPKKRRAPLPRGVEAAPRRRNSRSRSRDRGKEKRGPQLRSKLLEAWCAGFYMQSAKAVRDGGAWLCVADGRLAQFGEDSALRESRKPPSGWVVYGELTARSEEVHEAPGMRLVSRVEGQWIEPLLPRLEARGQRGRVARGVGRLATLTRKKALRVGLAGPVWCPAARRGSSPGALSVSLRRSPAPPCFVELNYSVFECSLWLSRLDESCALCQIIHKSRRIRGGRCQAPRRSRDGAEKGGGAYCRGRHRRSRGKRKGTLPGT